MHRNQLTSRRLAVYYGINAARIRFRRKFQSCPGGPVRFNLT